MGIGVKGGDENGGEVDGGGAEGRGAAVVAVENQAVISIRRDPFLFCSCFIQKALPAMVAYAYLFGVFSLPGLQVPSWFHTKY